jgi:3-phosphoshikimate 1-carboxyvinyltransferase
MTTPAEIEIQPATRVVGQIRPPGSKSITNRALLCAALADGQSTLRGALDSDDTRVMIDSLRRLGFAVEVTDSGTTVAIGGQGGNIPAREVDLFVGNSGTTARFLAAMVSVGNGRYRLDGVARMRQRPIVDLIGALRDLGVDRIESEYGTGCPPVIVQTSGLRGGQVALRGDVSSQFLSALLMAAPYAATECTFRIEGPLVSRPYVMMTAGVMEAFGILIDVRADSTFHVPARRVYRGREYEIEPDASAASYFWAAAAITGGEVTVCGLSLDSLQGDVAFCRCLERMGCRVDYLDDAIRVHGGELHGIDVDMNSISDTVQTLAAVSVFADGPTTIRGVGHNRFKETDRIGDLARELTKLGALVAELPDGLSIQPGRLRSARIDTYEDHRMAMSLALCGLRIPGVVIRDPGCTSKTYPCYFEDLERLCRSGGGTLR